MKSTIGKNLKGIPVPQLPKTFRDAILITRELQIRYLWIDSLCIIQDSPSDWTKHVSEMAHIYHNGVLTLAAGASSDDDGGFFTELTDKWSSPRKILLSDEDFQHEIFVALS